MATPSGAKPSISTPRPNPGATPTPQYNSSPHPSGPRVLSHRSPTLIRTPSASGHHAFNQSSTGGGGTGTTPLAIAAGLDYPAAMSSPSALMVLGGMGGSGITPSPNAGGLNAGGHDGAGVGAHAGDMTGVAGLGILNEPASEETRQRHFDAMLSDLRTRVTGREVCREGVERLGQLAGFACLWDEDNLTIAGNSVDLEIQFEAASGPNADKVKDVTLKFALIGQSDAVKSVEAADVLKSDLMGSRGEKMQVLGRKMEMFQENLQRLAALDRLSGNVNCLQAIEGMHSSLLSIWEAERSRSRPRSSWEAACKGAIGRPRLHQRGRIGLSLEYWVEKRRLAEQKSRAKADRERGVDAMDLDDGSDAQSEGDIDVSSWNVLVECETGYPSIRVSKEWVDKEVFSDSTDLSLKPSINWLEPPPTYESIVSSDGMNIDAAAGLLQGSNMPNVRFVARFEPPVVVPFLVANQIYQSLGQPIPGEFKVNTYDALILPSLVMKDGPDSTHTFERVSPGKMKQRKTVIKVSPTGEVSEQDHLYSFYPDQQMPGRILKEIPISHPRQLAGILPIVRQYARLGYLLKDLFNPSPSLSLPKPTTQASVPSTLDSKTSAAPLSHRPKPKLPLLSNRKSKGSPAAGESNALEVTVKLETPPPTSSSSPRIVLSYEIASEAEGTPKPDGTERNARIASIPISIGLGGEVSVDEKDLALKFGNRTLAPHLAGKLGTIVDMADDLSMLIEWVRMQV